MNTHPNHPNRSEISLQHAVPQEARQSPHMGLYDRADNPFHPTGVRCQDSAFARILDTLQPDGLYHLATFDPWNLDIKQGTMLNLQDTAIQKYLYGRDAAELVGQAINRLIETKTIALTSIDLFVANPPQLINTKQWEQIEALTGPLSMQDATALSNGLVIQTTINGAETNIAFREPEGIIKTNWPDYKAVNDTFSLLVNDPSHKLLSNLTSEQRGGYIDAIAQTIPPSLQQLQSADLTGMFPPLRYDFGVYISELAPNQLTGNDLTHLPPKAELNNFLIGPLTNQLESIKPDAPYRISFLATPEHDLLPIYRNTHGAYLDAVGETMQHKLEGHFVTGNEVKGVLSDLLTECNNRLNQKATVPHLELNNYQFTITAKQLDEVEKKLGPLDSYSVWQLANGKPITIDNSSYAFTLNDGKLAINRVDEQGATIPLTAKHADAKDVQLYRQAADTFGVMLSPETLTKLLSGQRSDMLMTTDDKVGKLVLVSQPGSEPVLRLLQKKETLTIPTCVAGYTLTTKDRENLTKYGEMGKLVPMVSSGGKSFKGYVGVDKDLNTVTILKAHQFKLPHSVKGVPLDESQREVLKQGRAVPLENMEGKNGPFHAFVRIAASSGKLSFQPINNLAALKNGHETQKQPAQNTVTVAKSVSRHGAKQPTQAAVPVAANKANGKRPVATPENKAEKTLTTKPRQAVNSPAVGKQPKPVLKPAGPKQKVR